MRERLPANVAFDFVEHSAEADGSAAWAQISGWAQLSGDRHSISCVLAADNAVRQLAQLLPELSDALTEAGQPWELVVVDTASDDGTDALMAQWIELPGFRWLRLSRRAGRDAAISIGLREARGDGVILVDPAAIASLRLIPEMVAVWESGTAVAYADSTGADGPVIRRWSPQSSDERLGRAGSFERTLDSSYVVLLDRDIVSLLLEPSTDRTSWG